MGNRCVMGLCALVVMGIPAFAKDLSLKLDDGQQQIVTGLPQLHEQCVAAVLIRGDATICRNMAVFLGAMATAVRQGAADQAAKDAAEADAAAKAAADQAAAQKAARDAAKAQPAAD